MSYEDLKVICKVTLLNKILFIVDFDKRMQSIDSIETYAYQTSKDLVTLMMLQKKT